MPVQADSKFSNYFEVCHDRYRRQKQHDVLNILILYRLTIPALDINMNKSDVINLAILNVFPRSIISRNVAELKMFAQKIRQSP